LIAVNLVHPNRADASGSAGRAQVRPTPAT
jgi:hypothetical protein